MVGFFLLSGCDDKPGRHPPDPARVQVGGTFVDVPQDFTDNPSVLSPPIIDVPLLECAGAVIVSGFIPGAEIKIFANGNPIGGGISNSPSGQNFAVSPELVSTEKITATQTWGGVTSDPSDEHTVVKHTDYYPSGLPKPDLKEPLYDCGIQTAVYNLPPGGSVEVLQDGIRVGWQASGVGANQAVRINPPFEEPKTVIARGGICTDLTPDSDPENVQPAPTSLPIPVADDIYEDSDLVVLWSMVNGANATISRGATILGGGGASGGGQTYRLNQSVSPGDVLDLKQELCGIFSPTGTVTVKPCSELPGVTVVRAVEGENHIHLANVVPGSRIYILADGIEIGDGGGSQIQLIRTLVLGETLIIIQSLGNCVSSEAYQVDVGTAMPDPTILGSCTVEKYEYGESGLTTDISGFFNSPDSSVSTSMSAVPLHGVVRYPTDAGAHPIALIVHGNHSPTEASEPGYDYLLDLLASHCIIAVSIDENFLNGRVGGEMDARAIVLLRHLQKWRDWNATPGHLFFDSVDFNRVGLAGHSRGGEAITVAAKLNTALHDPATADFDFNFGIRGLYAIAPVDGQINGDSSIPLQGYDTSTPLVLDEANYAVIHGSHDSDVATFDGHKTYDRAFPVTQATSYFKGLQFIYGANHSQWNDVWGCCGSSPCSATTFCDPTPLATPTAEQITRDEQKAILATYLSAFFLDTLKDQTGYRQLFASEITFASFPSNVVRITQYTDPQRTFIDHHEDDNDPADASAPGVTVSDSSLSPYLDYSFNDRGPLYWLWEETDGLIMGWRDTTSGTLEFALTTAIAGALNQDTVLSFRVGQVNDPSQDYNTLGATKDFTVQLLGVPGAQTVQVADYRTLHYPDQVGGTWTVSYTPIGNDPTKSVMSTVRIPLRDFLGGEALDLTNVTGLRFSFDRHNDGLLAFDEIQFGN